MSDTDFAPHVRESTLEIFTRARTHCQSTLEISKKYLAEHAARKGLDPAKICYAAGGSLGRGEALAASDFDLIPIFADETTFAAIGDGAENKSLRAGLSEALGAWTSRAVGPSPEP